MAQVRVKSEQKQEVPFNTTQVRIDPLYNLSSLLKNKNLTEEEIMSIIDLSAELSTEVKEISKVLDTSKKYLKELAKEKGVSSLNGNKSEVVFSKRTTSKITLSITDFAKFLKRIGKIHVFDHVVTVAMTPLKKYVDVYTLESEGVLNYETDDYGSASFKYK